MHPKTEIVPCPRFRIHEIGAIQEAAGFGVKFRDLAAAFTLGHHSAEKLRGRTCRAVPAARIALIGLSYREVIAGGLGGCQECSRECETHCGGS